MVYLSEGYILQASPLTVCNAGSHAMKGISHTCFWLCHSPRLYHAALFLWQSQAQHNPKSKRVTSLSLHWHTYHKLSSTAVFSHGLDRWLLPLRLPCVILWIGKWNYPSGILHFKSNTTSFPVKTSERFFHARNDCLWWNCCPSKISFIASEI